MKTVIAALVASVTTIGYANAGGVILNLTIDKPVVNKDNTCPFAEAAFEKSIENYSEHYPHKIVSRSYNKGPTTCVVDWTLDINSGHIRKVRATVKFTPPHADLIVLQDVTS